MDVQEPLPLRITCGDHKRSNVVFPWEQHRLKLGHN